MCGAGLASTLAIEFDPTGEGEKTVMLFRTKHDSPFGFYIRYDKGSLVPIVEYPRTSFSTMPEGTVVEEERIVTFHVDTKEPDPNT